jgi:multidrug efflux pump subunit AcrB
MWLIKFALRRPITVIVAIVAIGLGCALALSRIDVDIFPKLNLPVIYVAQPYGGMDPAQMEGLLTNYYEYHFLYISGIHHVESRNVQGVALMKLFFHPGTDMSQAMAETISYVNRSRAFMPPGTVSPFVMRFDTGSVPVGYLVLSSETRSLAEIQDLALFRVRPMFASLPGVSAPPPFGGNARTVVVRLDPDRLRATHVSPEQVVAALTEENTISPSGNLHLGKSYPIVPLNSMVKQVDELRNVPIKTGVNPAVYVRDVGRVEDAMDIPSGYALVNDRRAIYMVVTKRADASTLSVVTAVKAALPRMQKELPDDIKVSFEFDQSPVVTGSIKGLAMEAGLGALLTGLMVLLFLRDWRSVIVVVLNIPLALASAAIALWLGGQTINLMTLGGLALAVGILVDEATVEIENIHTQMGHAKSVARAVRLGNAQTAVPRLLAMLCILAVFIPSFFMQGAARALFVPMSLAVGFSMVASYILSSTFVPVLSTWLLRHVSHADAAFHEASWFERIRRHYHKLVERVVQFRIPVIVVYGVVSVAVIALIGARLGIEVFPLVESNQFRLRLRAPDGTYIDTTEQIAIDALKLIKQKVGAQNVDITLGYVGTIPSSYPINAVYQWSRGPEEAILWVALKHSSGVNIEQLKEDLRRELAKQMPDVRASFEPADIVNEVMSFGSPTPIDVAVSGANFAENLKFAEKLQQHLATIPALRDLQFSQSLSYPTVEVNVDRERAGLSGVTPAAVAKSIVTATSSSRFVVPNYWPDPKTGIGYQVQVEVPQAATTSMQDLGAIPLKQTANSELLLRDVAHVDASTMPGEYDRYNMKRQVSLTANISGEDLGRIAGQVASAITAAGEPPKGSTVEVRGQIPIMQEMLSGLGIGLLLAVVVIFLLLAANFQSWKLASVTVSTAPAVVAGVVLMLWVTGTTLNIQSFMGGIMAIGVAMANGILLVTFAESQRRKLEVGSQGSGARSQKSRSTVAAQAAVEGASRRLRPILMTSAAMIAGMLPMAFAFGEGGRQTAPLGRAVIGGLALATLATLFVLPCIFALVQRRAITTSASLDPDDPASTFFDQPPAAAPAAS